MSLDTPKLNPDTANGLAVKHLEETEVYINSIWHAAAKGFPEGFTFVKAERCMPQEEYNEATRKKNNKRLYDVATSYIYMMKYIFRFKGEDIVRYMYLPFVGDAGVIYMSGSRFVISPILADRVISIGRDNIFLRLIRSKVTFERMNQHFYANGRRESVQVVWSLIHHKKDDTGVKPSIRANTTLVHYLLCKYGMTEMFTRFARYMPIVGTSEDITPEQYPPSDWVICTSAAAHSGLKPKTYGFKTQYVPTNIAFAVPREHYDGMMKNMICGIFYILDHFPATKIDFIDNRRMWMIYMGEILFSSNINQGKLADDISNHIQSLDEYVDEVMKIKFREINLPIDDLYQLFAIIIENFNDWLYGASDKINSLYDKELSILNYVLEEITKQINKFYWKLKAAAKKDLKRKEIETMMNQTIKPALIYSITKRHAVISTTAASGDNKAFKITALLVPQSSSNKTAGRKDGGAGGDPTRYLHPSVAEIGGYSNLPKSDPTGHSRLNHCAQTDHRGVVLRNPKYAELLDAIGDLIRRSRN